MQRRAPFGDSPSVGARGTRTQQRILRAALTVFGELGYDACRVERITEAAGCSRPTFYQYFSSKEDLFRHLAGEVARELFRIAETLEPVTPGADGWSALRAWLSAHVDLYDEYWPVFAAFAAAEGSDELVASGAAVVGDRVMRTLVARIEPSAFGEEQPESVAAVLVNAVDRANRYRQLLARLAPDRAPDRERLLDSLAEVLHRSLFGRRGGCLVDHRPSEVPLERGRALPGAPRQTTDGLSPAARATRKRLLDAGKAVFARKGFVDARVDDIVDAGSASHGTFYWYFDNKEDVFRVIAARSGRRVLSAIDALPAMAGDPSSPAFVRRLRAWAADYTVTWAQEGPIFRAWIEALGSDPLLGAVSVAATDRIRAALARFLAPRGFGDIDMDAFLLLCLLDLTVDRQSLSQPPERAGDLLATVIRRGFLGVDARF